MFKALKFLVVRRDWQIVTLAGTLGFAIAFAVMEAAVAYSVSLHALSIALVVVACLMLSMGIGIWLSAWHVRQNLSGQKARLDAALNNMIQGLCMFDAQNRLLVWNERYRAMYNIDPKRIWYGCTIRDLLDARIAAGMFPLDPERYDRELRVALKQGKTFTLNIELADGRTIAVLNQPTGSGGWVATHEDITERKRAERELERTRLFLDTIIENVPSPIIVKEPASLKYLKITATTEKFLGVDRNLLLGKTSREVMPAGTAEMIEGHDQNLLNSSKPIFLDEHAVVTPGNGIRIVTATRLPVMGPDGKPQYLIAVIHDHTERKRDEQRIVHMAHHDLLTGLPNRTAFSECIAATLELAAASGDSFALLSLDLDRFKTVNDMFGHSAGDTLLRELASRLDQACEGAFVARVGGDEFAV